MLPFDRALYHETKVAVVLGVIHIALNICTTSIDSYSAICNSYCLKHILCIESIDSVYFPLLILVQSEEKIRVLHERKSEKLKRLDQKGAEAHKVDMTRQLVRSLSTKIRIAIQVVDKISEKINKIRDEELWPQLNEFIQGYVFFQVFWVKRMPFV